MWDGDVNVDVPSILNFSRFFFVPRIGPGGRAPLSDRAVGAGATPDPRRSGGRAPLIDGRRGRGRRSPQQVDDPAGAVLIGWRYGLPPDVPETLDAAE
jgi:hypothetical protein